MDPYTKLAQRPEGTVEQIRDAYQKMVEGERNSSFSPYQTYVHHGRTYVPVLSMERYGKPPKKP